VDDPRPILARLDAIAICLMGDTSYRERYDAAFAGYPKPQPSQPTADAAPELPAAPGDVLIVTVPVEWSDEEVCRLVDRLKEALRNTEIEALVFSSDVTTQVVRGARIRSKQD
jgi:hypothetical protein